MPTFLSRAAQIIEQIALQYNEAKHDRVDELHLRRMLSITIRNVTDHPSFPVGISVAAQQVALGLGIMISKMTYNTQPRWDPSRKIFAYEHMTPVNKLMRQIMAKPGRTEEILRSARVVWLLREEDQRLTDAGYKKHRDNPEKIYADLGIEVAAPGI